jgi:D-amino-acid oxidase
MSFCPGGGTILGGCYQVGNLNPVPDPDLAANIMRRAVDLHPNLTNGSGVDGLSVIRHAVGFRPLRPQGVRIDSQMMSGVCVVHNYGHGGWGYQASYGCARAAVQLVDEAFHDKAKL